MNLLIIGFGQIGKSHLKSFDVPESEDQIFESAKSYGFFLKALRDFNPLNLSVTIADFHNLDYRLFLLKRIHRDLKSRLYQVQLLQID